MKQLTLFLQKLPNKTAWVTAILFASIMLESSATLFSSNGLVITELVGSILLLVFRGLAPTGTFPKGMTALFWVSNILICVFQVGDLLTHSEVIGTQAILVIGKIQVVINGLLAALAGITPPPAPPAEIRRGGL